MFQFSEDIVAVSAHEIDQINRDTGSNHLGPAAALALASAVKPLDPILAMQLVEHPDARVPLAMALNRHWKWEETGHFVLRVALCNRAIVDANLSGALWSPLLDAAYMPNSVMAECVKRYGYRWRGAQGSKDIATNDPFLHGRYADRGEYSGIIQASLLVLAQITPKQAELFRKHYFNTTFWQSLCQLCLHRLRVWNKEDMVANPGYTLGMLGSGGGSAEERLAAFEVLHQAIKTGETFGEHYRIKRHGKKYAYIAIMDNYFKASLTVESLTGAWRILENDEVGAKALLQYASMLIRHTPETLEVLVELALERGRSQTHKGWERRRIACFLRVAQNSRLNAKTAQRILASSNSIALRTVMAAGPGRCNIEVAQLLMGLNSRQVLERLAEGQADNVVLMFDKMMKRVPLAVADAVARDARSGGALVERLSQVQMAKILARTNREQTGDIIAKINNRGAGR